MITQFKIFENINNGEPEVGDYAVFDCGKSRYYEEKDFFMSVPGRIYKINNGKTKPYVQYVTLVYNDPPNIHKKGLLYRKEIGYYDEVYVHDLIAFGKTKEEVEMKIQSNKYNL